MGVETFKTVCLACTRLGLLPQNGGEKDKVLTEAYGLLYADDMAKGRLVSQVMI